MPADSSRAVFLSYASHDAEAARRICDALCSAGVEVWFDQNELVGGDAWDAKIRKQIAECTLFVPVISAATQARREGYFRLEWRLAAQRTHMMSEQVSFLLPVVIDTTRDTEADVPAEFKAVQWIRLRPADPDGQALTDAFVARVQRLLEGRPPATGENESRPRAAAVPDKHPRPRALSALGLLIVVALALWRPWATSSPPASPPTQAPPVISEASRLVAKAWAQLDKVQMARNELMLAETYCRQAAALEADNPAVWAAWSATNTWLHFHGFERLPARKEAAHDYAQKALALDARSFEARYAWALYLVRMPSTPADSPAEGRPAVRILRELLQERPEEPRALFALGFHLSYDPGTFDEAAGMLERLAAKHPAFAARSLDELGWTALYLGRFAQAEAAADRSLAAQPYWNNLGLKMTLAMRRHGDLELAQATLARMPTMALQEDWGIGLACLLADWRGDYERALTVLQSVPREWIQHFFFQGPTSFLVGKVRLRLGQKTSAHKELRRALELVNGRLEKTPSDGWLLWVKAETLLLLDEKEAAVAAYRQHREVWPETFLTAVFEPPDQALSYLRAMLQRPYGTSTLPRWLFSAASLRLDPTFENLRKLPEFQSLIAAEERREQAQPRRLN